MNGWMDGWGCIYGEWDIICLGYWGLNIHSIKVTLFLSSQSLYYNSQKAINEGINQLFIKNHSS
jgi:hypothetical protein